MFAVTSQGVGRGIFAKKINIGFAHRVKKLTSDLEKPTVFPYGQSERAIFKAALFCPKGIALAIPSSVWQFFCLRCGIAVVMFAVTSQGVGRGIFAKKINIGFAHRVSDDVK